MPMWWVMLKLPESVRRGGCEMDGKWDWEYISFKLQACIRCTYTHIHIYVFIDSYNSPWWLAISYQNVHLCFSSLFILPFPLLWFGFMHQPWLYFSLKKEKRTTIQTINAHDHPSSSLTSVRLNRRLNSTIIFSVPIFSSHVFDLNNAIIY